MMPTGKSVARIMTSRPPLSPQNDIARGTVIPVIPFYLAAKEQTSHGKDEEKPLM